MAEKGHTSSITSVTEEDTSEDSESDTTESTNSNLTSSVISSTDTDDKLTPCLGGISITPSAKDTGGDLNDEVKDKPCRRKTTSSKVRSRDLPYSLSHQRPGKRQRMYHESSSFSKHHPHEPYFTQRSTMKGKVQLNLLDRLQRGRISDNLNTNNSRLLQLDDNLGVEDLDNKLSTDFSDTSSIAAAGDRVTSNIDTQEDEVCGHAKSSSSHSHSSILKSVKTSDQLSDDEDSWEPDMCSSSWYKAGCFSHYWQHYHFVMAWYQAHMDAVRTLSKGFTASVSRPWRQNGFGNINKHSHGPGVGRGARHVSTSSSRGGRSSRFRHGRRARRARSRRLAKARKKALSSGNEAPGQSSNGGPHNADTRESEEEEEEQEVEMEISDDLMAFFKTTLKHQMERDSAKTVDVDNKGTDETRVNIEDAVVGQTGPSSAPPAERPGARRALEMKQLYGSGAPMIHGMETALQMTFDRTQDKVQPKLWPNMPLKITFA